MTQELKKANKLAERQIDEIKEVTDAVKDIALNWGF
jgi:hypothetical protein